MSNLSVYENLYWFVKMVECGGPDGTDADAAVYEDGIEAARWIEKHNNFNWPEAP